MSCGCKNKGNQQAAASQPAQKTVSEQAKTTDSVKDSVKKIVEKYYNKK
jgi:hypothetical protein